MFKYTWVPTLFMPSLAAGEKPVLPYVLFFDIGGTKVLAEILDSKGRIVESVWKPSDLTRGPAGLLEQIVEMGLPLLQKYGVKRVDVSSAGPLDPSRGLWLNPTNLKTNGEHWGVVDVLTPLKKAFGTDAVSLENDAAAQALLMHHFHPLALGKDFLLLTLGTGVGVAIIKNGRLIRTSDGLHPELSHVALYTEAEILAATLRGGTSDLVKYWNHFPEHPRLKHPRLCGCGRQGCMETYLAGSYFVRDFAEDEQKMLMKEVFLPRTAGRLCDEYGVSEVFVSGNFGRFLG